MVLLSGLVLIFNAKDQIKNSFSNLKQSIMRRKFTLKPMLLTALLTFSIQLSAQETSKDTINETSVNSEKKAKPVPPWFARRIKVSAGLFIPVNNTKIEVGNESGSFGNIIDFEDDLGFEKSTSTFLGEFQWRASRRSRFDLSYFYFSRNSSHQLQRTIEFGEHTYPVDAEVNSYFKTAIYRFTYGYAFLVNPKYELGVMIGAHILKTDVGISLKGETAQVGYKDDFGFTAPLPDFGIWGGYAISDRFAFNGSVSYLALKIDNVSGKIISYNLSFMYKALENLDVSMGYTGLNFKVDVVKDNLAGYLKWGYNGPMLTASYCFGKKKPF
jgi:hypothetical protein